jgi:hypothetical protein
VSTRARQVVVGCVLLLLVGGAAVAIWRAPKLDLVPVARTFLVDLDEGRHLQALQGSLLGDRWDLMGLLENNAVRQRRLGKLVRVESASPPEEITLTVGGKQAHGRRQRMFVAFEREKREVVFTFARAGATWAVHEFDFGSLEPPNRAGLEQHLRRAGAQLAELVGRGLWTSVHNRLLRAERLAHPMEQWVPAIEGNVDGLGGFLRVEERAWRFADGRATFGARLVYDTSTKDVDLDLVYDPTEGRAVITRITFP